MEDAGATSSGTGEAIEAAAFIQTLQRDLNCLTDPDRSTRRKSLERLDKRLTKDDNAPTGFMLQIVWDETILVMLLRSLHDPVEKCRESATILLTDVVKLLDQVDHTCSVAIPAIAERIGQQPVLEPSEEIRVSLLNLLILLTSRSSVESIHETFEPLCRAICVSLGDPFHEIKKGACQLLSGVIDRAPDDDRAEAILKALLPNVTHAHSRVRLAVLSALNKVVLHGVSASMIAELVAPGLKGIAFDHSDAVREVLFACTARWLGYEGSSSTGESKNPEPYLPHLLPLLLLGITDESSDISNKAFVSVEGVGVLYEHFNPSKPDEILVPEPTGLPPPFQGLPGRGSRLMVQSILGHIVRACLKDLQDWTTITRLGAARLLQTSLVFAEAHSSSYLDRLIPALCSAVGDDELRVAKCVVQAAHVIASYTRPAVWLDLIMDPVINPRSTNRQRANSLVILAAFLYGSRPDSVDDKSILQISRGLSQAELFSDDSLPIRRQLFAVLNNLIVKGGSLCKVSSKEIFILLLQLQSAEAEFQLRFTARSLIDTFATTVGYESSKELYAAHMHDLINEAAAGHEQWLANSPRRLLFQTVLQNSSELAGPYLKEVLPVFVSCLQSYRDPALRIAFLQLLDALFETSGLESYWIPLAREVIQRILIPCGVWQPGKVGAAARHATMVALGTFLRRDLCNQADMLELIESEDFLPVVSSCLEEEFYVDTRRATCHVMENVIHIAGSSLKDEHRSKIGGLLEKRLDDSSDDVRLGIMRAIFAFFVTLSPFYSNSEVRTFLSSVLLHMDDQNLQIKEAVCRAAEQCALKKPAIVVDIVKDVRSKHQNPHYCDYLLTVAASVQTRDYTDAAA